MLVVEDFEVLRDSISQGLREAGFAVDAAADGETGLWHAQSNDYDVIILDLMLPRIDGLTGRDDSRARWEEEPAVLTRDNLWNRAISFTIFLRADIVARVGPFDERLGLPGSSSEEIDYLVRAVDAGARIEYDPALVVLHRPAQRPLVELGARDGESIGYVLRKHRYPPRSVARRRPSGCSTRSRRRPVRSSVCSSPPSCGSW